MPFIERGDILSMDALCRCSFSTVDFFCASSQCCCWFRLFVVVLLVGEFDQVERFSREHHCAVEKWLGEDVSFWQT